MEKIPISKANRIREEFIAGTLPRTNLAAELGINHYREWHKANKICRFYNRRVRTISAEDEVILNKWRNSVTREQWKKATVIFGSFNKRSLAELMAQIEKARETILLWTPEFKATSTPKTSALYAARNRYALNMYSHYRMLCNAATFYPQKF